MSKDKKTVIDSMFEVGAHIGYARTRRHPSTRDYVFGMKGSQEIINLEKTAKMLEDAMVFVSDLGRMGKTILFVGNKGEARDIVMRAAESLGQPYVTERWIGGTLTNFEQIRKRVNRLIELRSQKAKGELSVYTKKERGLMDKEMKDLERFFGGIVDMQELPKAIFVVDSRDEVIATKEAKVIGIPVISVSNTDCDIREIDYPIVANDRARKSLAFFVEKIAKAYQDGKQAPKPTASVASAKSTVSA